MIKTFLLVVVLLMGTTLIRAQSNPKVVTLRLTKYKKQMSLLSRLGFDIAGIKRKSLNVYWVDIVAGEKEIIQLQGLNAEFVITPMHNGGNKSAGKIDEEYHNSDEVFAFLKATSKAFSHITKLVKIGKSFEGRAIWALRITDNPNSSEKGEPSILFNSMHHAREIASPEVSIDIVKQLTNGYGKSKRITRWVNELDIWVVPMLNVDGNKQVWNGRTLWRKNTRKDPGARKAHGVDLNRNYPIGWNTCGGSSGRKSSLTYRGTKAASEPETRTLINLVNNIRPVINFSYHSYSQLVLYPLGCSGEYAMDRALVEGIGKGIAKPLGYKPQYGWQLYSADGGDVEWMYKRWGVLAYVIELGEEFHPRYDETKKIVSLNRKGWAYALDRMFKGGVDLDVKGHKNPTLVRVYKKGTSKVLSKYEVREDGTLRFLATPGEYDVKIKNGQMLQTHSVKVASKIENLRIEF